MELIFAAMFEDGRYAQSLLVLLSIADPDVKKSKLTEHGIIIIKNFALE